MSDKQRRYASGEGDCMVERVGDHVLLSWSNGVTLLIEHHDAFRIAQAMMEVASAPAGCSVLDELDDGSAFDDWGTE